MDVSPFDCRQYSVKMSGSADRRAQVQGLGFKVIKADKAEGAGCDRGAETDRRSRDQQTDKHMKGN